MHAFATRKLCPEVLEGVRVYRHVGLLAQVADARAGVVAQVRGPLATL